MTRRPDPRASTSARRASARSSSTRAATLVAQRRVPIEPYVSPQPGWARAGRRALLARDRRGVPRAVGDGRRAPRRDRRRRAHDPARDGRRDRRGRRRRSGRRSSGSTSGAPRACRRSAASCGLAFRSLGVARHGRRRSRPTARRTGSARNEPEIWRRDPPLPAPVGLPDPSADRPLRRLGRGARSATCRSTTSASRWAKPGDWRWTAVPVDPAWLPELVPPAQPLGDLTAAAAAAPACPPGPAGHRRGRRQGVRGARLGRARARTSARSRYGTTATINTTHRRYVEAIPLVPPYPAAIPGAYIARGPGLPRLLDGRVVQARVRRARGGPGGRARASRPRRCSTSCSRRRRRARWASSSSRTGRPACASRARRRRARSSASATSTPGPTSTGRSSRASPTRCARARERTAKRTEGAASASCASRAAAPRAPAAVQLTADVFGLPTSRPHTHETSRARARRSTRRSGSGLHPIVRDGGRRDDAGRRDARPGPRARTGSTTSCTGASTADVRPAEAALRGDPADHRLPAVVASAINAARRPAGRAGGRRAGRRPGRGRTAEGRRPAGTRCARRRRPRARCPRGDR